MKEYNSTYFEVHQSRMAFSLPRIYQTMEQAQEAIKHTRINEVERGYKPTDYIILKITVKTTYDDNDRFVSDTTHRERIFERGTK